MIARLLSAEGSMPAIQLETPRGLVQGTCDERFQPVADEFARNFSERGEVGASVCITHEGKTVVDLWGGTANLQTNAPWQWDTVATIFSCTKGAVAICAHVLVSRGLLDIEAPVTEYWPEFGQKGKDNATVHMMLDHSVGVPSWHEPLKPGGAFDWDYMAERLAAEEPWWKPGTRNGYHMISFGWTVGELVRRVSGKSLGTFFQDEIAKPLGIDFWIGTPESVEPRVAPILQYVAKAGEAPGAFVQALLDDRESLQAKSWLNTGGFDPNGRESHAAEIGGGGGISNARGLAGMYAPLACGGELNGVKLVDRDTLTRMARVSMATNEDATLLIPTRFALGFMKSMDNRGRKSGDRDSVVLSEAAFGHVGGGGSIGFADPACGMRFGYLMNQMGKGILLNDRGQALVDAAYRCLGYGTNAGGSWTR
jgi:CubicO group peptidase (beta-lactamase class C family)